MAGEWRLLYAGAVSGAVLGELPYLQASFTEQLNGVGSWSATIPFDEPDVIHAPDGAGGVDQIDRSAVVDFAGIAPGETVVYFERGGVILAAGIVWSIDLDFEAGTMQIAGGGLGSYYARRIAIDATFTGADQLDIAETIVWYSDTYHGLGIQYAYPTSGVLRDRTYRRIEAKPVLEALEQLAAVQNGFDWRFRAHREAGSIVRRIHLDYPAIGRSTTHVFEVGVNAALLNYSEDGTQLVNSVLALGAGEGVDKLTAYAGASLPAERLYMERTLSHVDVNQQTTLDGIAQRAIERARVPTRRISLVLAPDSEPALGTFDVGDRVRVRARKGWLNVADTFRVVEIAYAVDAGGEQTRLTLAGLESFEM